MKIGIKDIARTGHTTRWQIVRTARDQTLAEHLYLVTVYSNYLADGIYKPVGGIGEHEKLIMHKWAMTHDLPEVFIGDIATPTKELIKKVTKDQSVVDKIEQMIDPDHNSLRRMVENTSIGYIVKIADYIEAISFLNEEGIGKHANEVKSRLVGKLASKIQEASITFPKLNWGYANHILLEITSGQSGMISFETAMDNRNHD